MGVRIEEEGGEVCEVCVFVGSWPGGNEREWKGREGGAQLRNAERWSWSRARSSTSMWASSRARASECETGGGRSVVETAAGRDPGVTMNGWQQAVVGCGLDVDGDVDVWMWMDVVGSVRNG